MSDIKEKRETIKPELLGGFKDYLPEVMIARQEVIDSIRKTFELYGFLPLDTPCLERSSVLGSDKDEFKTEVYRFSDSYGSVGQDVTLRFDLTVPLSRVVAANPKLLKPFKRYQYGKVFRKEKPQAGRFREFAQFDADIVGSDSILADTEIIQLMYNTFKNLGIDNFVIRFNNRKILNGLPAVASFAEEKAPDVFRVLDKLDKIGLDNVLKELGRQPENQYDESALALTEKSVEKVREFLSISGDSTSLVEKLKSFFAGVTIAEQGVAECEQIIVNLNELGIPETSWSFDLSIARGLGYYTGPVFETTLLDIPEIGSVFSGGRFDELIMRYTGERLPAVGASVGVDRLIAALEQLGKLPKRKCTARVLCAVIDKKIASKIMGLAAAFRTAGINTEVYLGKESGIKEQVIYAAKQGIPYMIIVGEEENSLGKVKLKDMNKREEYLLTETEAIAKVLSQNNF